MHTSSNSNIRKALKPMHIYISKSQQTYLNYSGGSPLSNHPPGTHKIKCLVRFYKWLHDRMEISSSIRGINQNKVKARSLYLAFSEQKNTNVAKAWLIKWRDRVIKFLGCSARYGLFSTFHQSFPMVGLFLILF